VQKILPVLLCSCALWPPAAIAINGGGTTNAEHVIPTQAAMAVFAQARRLCRADDGRLWGISLCGPLMLGDPQTHQAVANEPVAGATREGNLYRFTLPPNFTISDAPITYDGKRWAEAMWPPFGNADTQAVTLMHESFHRIQPQLGFNGYGNIGIAEAGYLDTEAGRIWLRGELNALRTALESHGSARKTALRDALAMRAYRHALFPQAAKDEQEQDIMEGLAESTGIDVALPTDHRIAYAVFDIDFVEAAPSYVRAFPYATGPAYSELLDAVHRNWRRNVTPSTDLEKMAAQAYGIDVTSPTASEAQAIIANYDGAAIEQQEAARAARKAALDKRYVGEFITGSTLRLPMKNFSIQFNPRDIEQFKAYGSVYHTLTVTGPWGKVKVSGGDAMISKDFDQLTVAAPNSMLGKRLHGQGWSLELSPGTKVIPDPAKPGSYIVVR